MQRRELEQVMRHTISVLVENKPGVLARIAGLFSARGFNIDSLTVGRTEDPTISEMTVVAEGDDRVLEQISKQLYKLIDVIKVEDLTKTGVEFVERELVLVKVELREGKEEFLHLVKEMEAKILYEKGENMLIEIVGEEKHIEECLKKMERFDIQRIFRTGKIAMKTG